MGEARLNRDRHAELQTTVLNPPNSFGGATTSALAVTITLTTYPTTASTFYAMNPQALNGSEVEGGTATPVTDTATVLYAFNLGAQIPPNGTTIVIHAVGGRWTFRYDG